MGLVRNYPAPSGAKAGVYLELEYTGSPGDETFGVTWGSPAGSSWSAYNGVSDCLVFWHGDGTAKIDGNNATGESIGAWGAGDRMGLLLFDRMVWVSNDGTWTNGGAAVAALPLSESTFYPFVYGYTSQTWTFYTGADLLYLPDVADPFDFSSLSVINDGGSASVSDLDFSGLGTGRTSTALPIITMS
jgi:hypothetical protein